MSTKTHNPYIDEAFASAEKDDPNIHKLSSGDRIFISSYIDGGFLQLFEETKPRDLLQFKYNPLRIERNMISEE